MDQKTLFHYPSPKTGERRVTYAGVIDEESKTISIGKAECSKKDQFVKKIGRKISTGRASKTPIKVVGFNQLKGINNLFVESLKDLI